MTAASSVDRYLHDRYAFHAAAVDRVRAEALLERRRETKAALAEMIGPLSRERRLFERLLEERGVPPEGWKDGLARLALRLGLLKKRLAGANDSQAEVERLEDLGIVIMRTAVTWRLVQHLQLSPTSVRPEDLDRSVSAVEDRLAELRRLRLAAVMKLADVENDRGRATTVKG